MEQINKQASELTITELKVMKCDHMDQMAFIQNQIQLINTELATRAKAQATPVESKKKA